MMLYNIIERPVINIVYIVSGGSLLSSDEFYINMIKSASVTIACDSGIKLFRRFNMAPSYLIGDMDSAEEKDVEWAKSMGVKVLKFPPEKNELDTELALIMARGLQENKAVLSGVLGSRIDQSMAGIYLLAAYNDLDSEISEEYINIGTVKKRKVFNALKDETWTVLPLGGQVNGLNLLGYKYELTNKHLNPWDTLGVSNQAAGEKVEISLSEGIVCYIRWIGKKV
jgi:thiamine pyrophosphokinase